MHRESRPHLNIKADSRKCGVETQANSEICGRHQGFRGPEPVYRTGTRGFLVYGTFLNIVGRHG
jgi:hypothetical protein